MRMLCALHRHDVLRSCEQYSSSTDMGSISSADLLYWSSCLEVGARFVHSLVNVPLKLWYANGNRLIVLSSWAHNK